MQSRRRFSDSGSKRFNVALCTALAGAAVCVSTAASAQNFPFPSTNITNGLTTSVLTTHEIEAQYAFWKATFLQNCGADIRVRYPESGDDTRSEGVGYGMVIAAYMGDQPTFNGLWNYYKRSSPADTGLMHWRRDGCNAGGGGGDTGSASDADIDAAFGLVVAADQWGANAGPAPGYGPESSRLVAAIRTRLFQGGCNGILLAGTQFADCGCINPSYIPPGYYPAFGAADQAGFWTTARTASYTYFNLVNNNTTGLVPAWSASNGGGSIAIRRLRAAVSRASFKPTRLAPHGAWPPIICGPVIQVRQRSCRRWRISPAASASFTSWTAIIWLARRSMATRAGTWMPRAFAARSRWAALPPP